MPDTAIAQRFAENLSHEIAKASLTQTEVAARAGMHRARLVQLLRGKQVPRLDTLLKLAAALDISPINLLEGMVYRPKERHDP